MAAELIDLLFTFWCILALAVYLFGNLFKSKSANEPAQKHQQQTNQLETTRNQTADWRSYNNHEDSYTRYSNQHQSYTSTIGQYDDRTAPSLYYQTGGWSQMEPAELHATSGAARSHLGVQQPEMTSFESSALMSDQRLNSSQTSGLSGGASQPIPVATGYSPECVDWINQVLYLFFTDTHKYCPMIAENIYRSLNEKVSNLLSSQRLAAGSEQLSLEFGPMNLAACSRPELTNVRTEIETDKSISVNCKIYVQQMSANLQVCRPKSLSSSHQMEEQLLYGGSRQQANSTAQRYELVLQNLEGKLKCMAMLNEKLLVIQFTEKPDMKILLKPLAGGGAARKLIDDDALGQLILQALTQVVIDMYFGDDVDFPLFSHVNQPQQHQQQQQHAGHSNYRNKLNNIFKGSASELKRQFKHDFFGAIRGHHHHHHHHHHQHSRNAAEEQQLQLFVKVIQARNINYNQNVTSLIQLDQPYQQAVSSTKLGSSNPSWNEHFLFVISEKSTQLTIELWDSVNVDAVEAGAAAEELKQQQQQRFVKQELLANAKFLGLARVPINETELRSEPAQQLSLTLQPIDQSAYDLSNSVGGELQIELLFLESPPPPADFKAGGKRESSSARKKLRKSNSISSLPYQQGDIVSIDRKLTPSGYVITTTTITKQQQQQRAAAEESLPRNQSPVSSTISVPAGGSAAAMIGVNSQSELDARSSSRLSQLTGNTGDHFNVDRQSESMGAAGDTASGTAPAPGRLSRSRSRSRSLLRAIKKRFSFSRTRSRSVGAPNEDEQLAPASGPSPSGSNLEALSMESRSRASSEMSQVDKELATPTTANHRARSVPVSRDSNEVPTIVINKGRLSDTASAFTFTHPKSQLVIEVLEPGLREDGNGNKENAHFKYYAIPDEAANKRKWRKRGTKLHLFNEHQFVACHLAGSSTCHLCGRVFSRRPGKQGYRCRNCHLLSHKQCHVKVDHNCPYATSEGLKLEYIDADAPENLVDEVNQFGRADRGTSLARDNTPAAASTRAGVRRTASSVSSRASQGTASKKADRQRGKESRAFRMTTKSISMEMDDR